MPSAIENYVHWVLQSVEVVTAHSAIFKFATDDLKRGTPHPRGSGRMAKPVTWHVTMLGAVGANGEGPLPWIERDYTPISSALEWERGRCEILIKIYSNGQLTSWLDRLRTAAPADDTRIWLSRPIKTLSVPSLATAEGGGEGFQPASVLLLLAGTGIVALPQILAHREPIRLLGIPTNRSSQLPCPIDLIQSCREDDLLLLPQGHRRCCCRRCCSCRRRLSPLGIHVIVFFSFDDLWCMQQSHDGRGPLCREHLSPIASRIAAVVSVLAVETGEPGLLSTGLPQPGCTRPGRTPRSCRPGGRRRSGSGSRPPGVPTGPSP